MDRRKRNQSFGSNIISLKSNFMPKGSLDSRNFNATSLNSKIRSYNPILSGSETNDESSLSNIKIRVKERGRNQRQSMVLNSKIVNS